MPFYVGVEDKVCVPACGWQTIRTPCAATKFVDPTTTTNLEAEPNVAQLPSFRYSLPFSA